LKRTWRYAIPVGIVVLGGTAVVFRLTGSVGSNDPRRQPIPLVHVEKPARDTIVYRLQLTGDVLPLRQTNIISKVGGTLERFYVDMGTAVRDNQLLATIDSTELREQYQQTAATYQNSRATYERVLQLFDKALASNQDVDNAEASMKVARANMELASTRLSYARIRAPFAGVITRRFLDLGAVVSANTSLLFTLMDLDTVKIIVNVPEKDVPSVYGVHHAGVTVDALPEMIFDGRVTRYSEALDLATRTMAVEVSVPNPDRRIKPGMFAAVTMTLGRHENALTIPITAILRDGEGSYVFAVEERTARQVRIRTGLEQMYRAEVLSGLAGNESIVVAGQQFLRNGGQVNIQP